MVNDEHFLRPLLWKLYEIDDVRPNISTKAIFV